MTASHAAEPTARFVGPRDTVTLEILGPTVEILTGIGGPDDAPCLIRGTIPPGVVVPMHSHAEPETFLGLSGELEALVVSSEGPAWIPVGPGDVFDVPGQRAPRLAQHHVRARRVGRRHHRSCRPLLPRGRDPGRRAADAGPTRALHGRGRALRPLDGLARGERGRRPRDALGVDAVDARGIHVRGRVVLGEQLGHELAAAAHAGRARRSACPSSRGSSRTRARSPSLPAQSRAPARPRRDASGRGSASRS